MRSLGLVATQTLTFLFTDIEDSTAMAQRLGDAWARVLADHHRHAWLGGKRVPVRISIHGAAAPQMAPELGGLQASRIAAVGHG
jgi:hypothetical protein